MSTLTRRDFVRGVRPPPAGEHTVPSSLVLHPSYLRASNTIRQAGTCAACHSISGLSPRKMRQLIAGGSRYGGGGVTPLPPAPVPLPGAALLFASALGALFVIKRRKHA